MKNYERKSTEGLQYFSLLNPNSLNFILIWVIGDFLKTSYYYILQAPIQLFASAIFQLLIDLLILSQFWFYKENSVKHIEIEQEMEISVTTNNAPIQV